MNSHVHPVMAQVLNEALASTAARALVQQSPGKWRFGQWTITYDPPPIPIRDCDYRFSHDDFDASYEGEEDGWVGNGLSGTAPSLMAALAEIAMIEVEAA
jgi:hypothetical protein